VPFAAPVIEQPYRMGRVQWTSETWQAEVLGLATRLEAPVGDVVTVSCPYRLGDDNCGYDISGDVYDDVRVDSVGTDSRRVFYANSTDLASTADDFFGVGRLYWLTGGNAGLWSEIKKFTNGGTPAREIVLSQATPAAITTSDTFYIEPGCRGRYVADCITKWSWGRRFGGDPFMPGAEAQFQTPQR
jgi:uncharacterized phage protein (TIGR02218 family)